jgi:hypothetical protein
MEKKPRCRLGRHKWIKRETTDGDVYGECSHCGERDWGLFARGGVREGPPGHPGFIVTPGPTGGGGG